jgi:hypothetical protein
MIFFFFYNLNSEIKNIITLNINKIMDAAIILLKSHYRVNKYEITINNDIIPADSIYYDI